jgi:hypothetical protein
MTRHAVNDLKRRVRKLKRFEKTIRVQNIIDDDVPLVWDKFFDLHDIPSGKAMYSITDLSKMSREEYKLIVDDFFARVYYEIYAFKGFTDEAVYDTDLLAKLDLSPIAGHADVKKRFRELAKMHHPDVGGDAAKFIDLMTLYKKLVD